MAGVVDLLETRLSIRLLVASARLLTVGLLIVRTGLLLLLLGAALGLVATLFSWLAVLARIGLIGVLSHLFSPPEKCSLDAAGSKQLMRCLSQNTFYL